MEVASALGQSDYPDRQTTPSWRSYCWPGVENQESRSDKGYRRVAGSRSGTTEWLMMSTAEEVKAAMFGDAPSRSPRTYPRRIRTSNQGAEVMCMSGTRPTRGDITLEMLRRIATEPA
jgi:hypothetical protein